MTEISMNYFTHGISAPKFAGMYGGLVGFLHFDTFTLLWQKLKQSYFAKPRIAPTSLTGLNVHTPQIYTTYS